MAKEKIGGRVHIDVDKIDKSGIWTTSFEDNNGNKVKKKYLTLDIFINNKEDKYGKDIYIHQSLGKMMDDEGNEVIDTDTGKVKYGKVEFVGKGKTIVFQKKEKVKKDETEYHQEEESEDLPF